jgi:hypothetical protein
MGRQAAWSVWLALVLAGCSGPVGLYHSVEGGAIAQDRAPPPGADQPYPNLADVPPPPVLLTPAQEAKATAQASGAGVSAPSPQALQGLDLPGAPPPVPGIEAAAPKPAAPPPQAQAAPPAPRPPGPAIALAFPPHSAILPLTDLPALQKLATSRAGATILAGGLGDTLPLALARAQRLADALTADGVPPNAIKLTAQAGGQGGFIQLVY